MQRHTSGPWVVGFGDTKELGNVYGVGLTTKPDWTVICVVSKAVDVTDQDIANAHLIAAAPELLEALQELYEDEGFGRCVTETPASLKAKLAIAKAKGE